MNLVFFFRLRSDDLKNFVFKPKYLLTLSMKKILKSDNLENSLLYV